MAAAGTFTTNGAIRNSRIADAVGPSMLRTPGDPTSAVCVKTPRDLTTVIPGCVPLNLFGGPNNGTIDPAQIGYLGFQGTSRALDTLFTVDANIGRDIVNLGADRPIALVLGYQFRRQSGAQIADPIAASGDSADFNFTSTQGRFTANEVYGELSVPILANVPGVQNLEASLAGRYVNYSSFGGKFTGKVGARYSPCEELTQRLSAHRASASCTSAIRKRRQLSGIPARTSPPRDRSCETSVPAMAFRTAARAIPATRSWRTWAATRI